MPSYVTLHSRFPEIIAKLELERGAIQRAAAEPVAEIARVKVPVDTGQLRDSIEVDEDGVHAAWYAPFVEHGTVNAPAQPFLVPAAELGKKEAEAVVAAWLRSL